jgi:hypothetical protein
MKLKAKDTLHVSSAGPDTIRAGQQFEVSDSEGKELIDRGLATRVAAPKAKAASAPSNKMARAPANKGAAPAKRKR